MCRVDAELVHHSCSNPCFLNFSVRLFSVIVRTTCSEAPEGMSASMPSVRFVLRFLFWANGDIRNQHRHGVYSYMGSLDGGSDIWRFSSCTDMPSNSAALDSETISSDRARKHKRLKRCGSSPCSRYGSSKGGLRHPRREKSRKSLRNNVSLKMPRSLHLYVRACTLTPKRLLRAKSSL